MTVWAAAPFEILININARLIIVFLYLNFVSFLNSTCFSFLLSFFLSSLRLFSSTYWFSQVYTREDHLVYEEEIFGVFFSRGPFAQSGGKEKKLFFTTKKRSNLWHIGKNIELSFPLHSWTCIWRKMFFTCTLRTIKGKHTGFPFWNHLKIEEVLVFWLSYCRRLWLLFLAWHF